MLIWTEPQACVKCDVCMLNDTSYQRRDLFIKQLRKGGWKIGKQVLCPSCANTKVHTQKEAGNGKQ